MKSLTNLNLLEFDGIPSGDGGASCWDVDEDTFKRFEEIDPDDCDRSFVHDGFYRCYSIPFMPCAGLEDNVLYRMRIRTSTYSDGSVQIDINAETIRRMVRRNNT